MSLPIGYLTCPSCKANAKEHKIVDLDKTESKIMALNDGNHFWVFVVAKDDVETAVTQFNKLQEPVSEPVPVKAAVAQESEKGLSKARAEQFISDHPPDLTYAKEKPRMEAIREQATEEMTAAMWRVAANKAPKVFIEPIIRVYKAKTNGNEEACDAAREFLKSEMGSLMLQGALGTILELMPQVRRNEKLAKLCFNMRQNAIAGGMDKLADMVIDPAMEAFSALLDTESGELEKILPSLPEVATTTKQREVEMVEAKPRQAANQHAMHANPH